MTQFTGLMGQAGTGKMLPNEELVLTPNGFIRNDSLQVGNYVIAEDGNPTQVIKIHEGKNLPIYKVEFSDGCSIEACRDHLWKVSTDKGCSYTTQSTIEIMEDMYVNNYSIPMCSFIATSNKELTIDPYEFGRELVLNPSTLIPKYYMYPLEQRLYLLRGLLDAAGMVSKKKKLRFLSTSIRLYEFTAYLVRSIGGLAITEENPPVINRRYSLSITVPFIFKSSITNKTYDPKRNPIPIRSITSITYIGKKDGRCIEVDSPLHTYIAKDFIVTHNSHTIRRELSEDPTYCLKTASTGIAAVNLQDESGSAITINSALGYFDDKDLLFKVASNLLDKPLQNIAKKYKRIALDEVSMINSGTLSLIHRAITDFNTRNNSNLGLMIIGDLAQLPPITGKPIFNSKAWSQFKLTYLTEVKRQADKELVEALSYIRKGEVDKAVDYFESEVGFHKEIDSSYEGSTFFSKNIDVDRFNKEQLTKLSTLTRYYPSHRKGQCRTEWNNIPDVLELKEGALVICLHNNSKTGYANGDLGKVIGLAEDYIEIELNRNGERVAIPYLEVHNEKFGYKVGSINYLPVKLGWACSAHRSQGLTLDRVQAKLGDSFMSRTHGMGYVVMSRARTKEGIRLICTREEFKRSFFFDPIYKKYIK
jgi:hypothetical protein